MLSCHTLIMTITLQELLVKPLIFSILANLLLLVYN